jgi:glycosyltransferase involved in cell wall biosynthesis
MHNNREKKLRLGIDAKWFFEGPPSGHMVVKNLVDEIIRNNDNNFDIYLLMNRKDEQRALAHFPAGTKIIFLVKLPNLITNALLLPVIARRYSLDVLMLQNFNVLWSRKVFKVVYIHDALFLDYPQYYSFFERLHFGQMKTLARNADRVITISNTERERMIKHHFSSPENITVVYHGINPGFKPLISQPIDTIKAVINSYALPERYVLYVGRVNARKNLITLIKSFALLQDTGLKLLIVGGGFSTQKNKLNELIDELNLADRIIFTGHVPEEDLYLIYAAAVVFCFPSYAEGFGLPPLEAMCCGVPVIVSNRTSIPEICGNAAIYASPDSAKAIAKEIDNLLCDERLYHEKMIQGIDHAAGFTWKKSADEILTLITNAYADRKSYTEA